MRTDVMLRAEDGDEPTSLAVRAVEAIGSGSCVVIRCWDEPEARAVQAVLRDIMPDYRGRIQVTWTDFGPIAREPV